MSSVYGGDGTQPTSQAYARIAIASSTNASPIVVTTSTNHNLTTGDTVVIEGHQTNTNANGRFVVTVLSATTFQLTGVAGNGVGGATGYVISYAVSPQLTIPSDGDLRNASSVNVPLQGNADKIPFLYERVGKYRLYNVYTARALDDGFSSYSNTVNATVNTATVSITTGNGVSPIVVTTTANHPYLTGDTVQITGVVGNTAANGTWVITKLTNTTFSLGPSSTGNGAYTSGGACSGFWGNLTGMSGMITDTPGPVCNFNDVFEVFFSTTVTTNAAGTEALGLGLTVGAGVYQFIPGSAVRLPASYSSLLSLVGYVKVGDAYQPNSSGQNNLVFNFSVMDQGNAGSPVTVDLRGHRELVVNHYRPN